MTPAPLSPARIAAIRDGQTASLEEFWAVCDLAAEAVAMKAQASAAIPDALRASEEMEGLKVRVARLEAALERVIYQATNPPSGAMGILDALGNAVSVARAALVSK